MADIQTRSSTTLAGLSLFADLPRPQLAAVAHTLDEESYADGQRILRQGFSGTGFYVVARGRGRRAHRWRRASAPAAAALLRRDAPPARRAAGADSWRPAACAS